jgi:glycosyltransferase involved in cell wall biosynthesis
MTQVEGPTPTLVTLIGHPFANVGMGEQLRSHMAACQSVHLSFNTVDIFRHAPRTDPDHVRLIGSSEIDSPIRGIRIFHTNADEIDRATAAFEQRHGRLSDGYNIIVPAWELPKYPLPWAAKLRKFDEVWALSHFIAESLRTAQIKSVYIGQSVETRLGYRLPRRYFGIRESAFTILHFFDLTSYATRKNPEAVFKTYEAIRSRQKFRDVQLVLKVKKADDSAKEWVRPIRERFPEAVCIEQPMKSLETRSLISCSDCFASLHRAEGFGRGTGEAMFLGRLALATAYSGNLDYMTKSNSLLVDYKLQPVRSGEYPFHKGQVWAEPDIQTAVELLDEVIRDPERARKVAAMGQRDVRLNFSHRAVGVRILDRITEIQNANSLTTSGKTSRHERRPPGKAAKKRRRPAAARDT